MTTSFNRYWGFRGRDWSPRTPEHETWIWNYIVSQLTDCPLRTAAIRQTAASCDKRVARVFGKNGKINDC